MKSQLEARYDSWSEARLAYDREALEEMVAADFHVLLYGREISGEQFLSDVSKRNPRGSLTRFDASILTVRPSDEGWTVVISEKLEIKIKDDDGEILTVHSFWVTRDGWRMEEGSWKVTFSEAIGHQSWKPGVKPPIAGW